MVKCVSIAAHKMKLKETIEMWKMKKFKKIPRK